MRGLVKIGAVISFAAILFVSAGMIWLIRGVVYWWRVLPPESVFLERQMRNDIFSGVRGPGVDNGQDVLYAETLSPLLLNGLGLPSAECSLNPSRKGRLNLANPLVLYMRSKGMNVAYCKGSTKSCWPVDSVLSSVAFGMKYSDRTLKELYLILYDFKSVETSFMEILGHSCRDVSPEEAAVISRWVEGPTFLENTAHTVRSIQKEAALIATSCRKPYVPAASKDIEKLLSVIHDYRESHFGNGSAREVGKK